MNPMSLKMGGLNIVVVEDELLIAKHIIRVLKQLEHAVVGQAASGKEAIQVVADKQPDLVLMDIVLKGEMDGIEAAQQIQSLFKIPVIFLTAYADNETIGQAKDIGGYGFIVKPFKAEQLNATIQLAISQHQAAAEIWELATTDSLTGIMNRRQFMSLAEQEFRRTRRYHHLFSLLILDIDHFKRINDSYGHMFGDQVIKAVVQEVAHILRKTDYLGRFGGEEFVILLSESDSGQALLVAQRILEGVAATTFHIREETVSVTVSIGVTTYQTEDESLDALLERADEALYQAKRQGRNRAIQN
jgi:diguanylate cyclase (GGDEF)-like protein